MPNGTYGGADVKITVETAYPVDGNVKISVSTGKPVSFALRVRVPSWTGESCGYKVYEWEWHNDEIVIDYRMDIRTERPMTWDEATVYIPGPTTVRHNEENDRYVALFRGPITLAVDSRMGKAADAVFDFEPIGEICADREIVSGVPCLLKMRFADKNGEEFYLVDYSSAGKDWETEIAAWLRTE